MKPNGNVNKIPRFSGDPKAMRVYVEAAVPSCPPRHLETEKLRKYFERNKVKLVDSPSKAGIMVLNTCALVESLERRVLERIRELQAFPGKLIVVGCIKYINNKALRAVFDGISLAPKELDQIDSLFPEFKHKFSAEGDVCSWSGPCVPGDFAGDLGKAELSGEKHWFVQASQGCEMSRHCSYCAIWKSTGKYISKPLEVCLEEVKRGVGRKTLHLMDSGAYGTDIGLSFPVLLRAVLHAAGDSGIFLHCLNPKWVIKYEKELAALVRDGRIKNIRFAHQSGSDRILRLMDRPYSARDSLRCVLALKKALPSLKTVTQLMVGFPSETEADFRKTVNLVNEAEFDDLDVFAFSPRPGTAACRLPGRLSPEVIARRVQTLERLVRRAGPRE